MSKRHSVLRNSGPHQPSIETIQAADKRTAAAFTKKK